MATRKSPLPDPVSVEIIRPLSVTTRLERSELERTEAAPLWIQILTHSEHLGFNKYNEFLGKVLDWPSGPDDLRPALAAARSHRHPGLDPYQLLRVATDVFLLTRVGAWNARSTMSSSALEQMFDPGKGPTRRTLPPDSALVGDAARGIEDPASTYGQIRSELAAFLSDRGQSYLDAILPHVVNVPADQVVGSPFASVGSADPSLPCLLELIWSYWHEEGMLCQTTNAIGRRFQNIRRPGTRNDPLAELELDVLRPMSTFLWSYVNDEPNRLSVVRRAYEYQHHYGLSLYGKATEGLSAADCRSQFLEAFHELLRRCTMFYLQDDDGTVTADAFPVLQALKEVHLVLAEGAHNQFRDLPWTARSEMMVEQWLLARPEMREFLRGRLMTPYPEPWMGTVDTMKRVQSWGGSSSIHFNNLGVFGERLLLSIRYFAWINELDQEVARTWARFWRPEVQSYIHAYRVVTGVDLGRDDYADATLPSELLRRRLSEQRVAIGDPAGRGLGPASRSSLMLGASSNEPRMR
jgi:hypothetical protein